MSESVAQVYAALMTPYGKEVALAAYQGGPPVTITHMAVGYGTEDSADGQYIPDLIQADLHGEWYRFEANKIFVPPENPYWLVTEGIIKENIGGHWINEVSLIDHTGRAVAISTWPATYKPLLAEGGGTSALIRITLQVKNTDSFELTIDTSLALVTRDEFVQLSDTVVQMSQQGIPLTARFGGDGTATDFPMPGLVSDESSTLLVSINGIEQDWTTDYTIVLGSPPIVRFTSPPADGVQINVRTFPQLIQLPYLSRSYVGVKTTDDVNPSGIILKNQGGGNGAALYFTDDINAPHSNAGVRMRMNSDNTALILERWDSADEQWVSASFE